MNAQTPDRAGVGTLTELRVAGMSCGNCARHVTDALQRVPGVHSATVDLAGGRAGVRWSSGGAPNPPAWIEAVASKASQAQAAPASGPHDAAADPGEHAAAGWRSSLWLGVIGTALLMLGEWAFHWQTAPWF